jgi:hypothetical protein
VQNHKTEGKTSELEPDDSELRVEDDQEGDKGEGRLGGKGGDRLKSRGLGVGGRRDRKHGVAVKTREDTLEDTADIEITSPNSYVAQCFYHGTHFNFLRCQPKHDDKIPIWRTKDSASRWR